MQSTLQRRILPTIAAVKIAATRQQQQQCRSLLPPACRAINISHRTFFSSGSSSSSSSPAESSHESESQHTQHHDNTTIPPKPPMIRRPSIKPHPLSPTRFVPDHIEKPNYAYTGRVNTPVFSDILLHSQVSIARMKTAARLARQMLDFACSCVDVGVSTDDIDALVHEEIIAHRAYPSPLNYAGFPKSLCTSVNEVICHGIPDARRLEFGDVISLDVSCFVNGVHGDNCATVIVGDYQESVGSAGVDWRGVPMKCDFDSNEDQEKILAARRLVQATREALYAGIEACRPGGCLSNVGAAIHDVADAYGYDTVQKYRGHGISHEFHCPPFVKHYRNSDRVQLVPGMIFTIEPMFTEGNWDCREWADEWTVVTLDRGLSAQFEHTVLITDTGVEILTLPE